MLPLLLFALLYQGGHPSVLPVKRMETHTYYLTHVATEWFSFLLVDHLGSENQSYRLTLFDEFGTTLHSSERTLSAGAFEKLVIADLAAAHSGIIETESPDLFFRVSFVHPAEGGTAEFALPTRAAGVLAYNFGNYTPEEVELTFKGLALFNTAESATTVALTAVDAAGQTLAETTLSLTARQRYRAVVSSIFPETSFQQVARVLAAADQPLTGLALSGKGGAQLLFGNAVPLDALPGSGGATTWQADLSVAEVFAISVGEDRYNSSTRLDLSWQAPAEAPAAYVIQLTEQVTGSQSSVTVDGALTSTQIGNLKSETGYSFRITACLDGSCETNLEAETEVQATTPTEVWQLYGEGNGWENTIDIVDEANTKPYVLPYGDWAGDLSGDLRLYYDPAMAENKGLRPATLTGPVTQTLAGVSQFTSHPGFGLLRTGFNQGQNVPNVSTQQAVPLANGVIRLFMEGDVQGHKAHVFYVDSKDGYLGLDFHAGEKTLCETEVDYADDCAITHVIGHNEDVNDLSDIRGVRQFKIIYPTLDSWVWDQAVNTPMVVTLHWVPGNCSELFFNGALAHYDGSNWVLELGDDGCARHWTGMQSPSPMHLGDNRYKIYYNDNQTPAQNQGTPFDDKPLRIIYGERNRDGDDSRLSFADWDSEQQARQVTVLWPDGGVLDNIEDERFFDDFHFLMPTNNPNFQVVYTNTGHGGITSAALINP